MYIISLRRTLNNFILKPTCSIKKGPNMNCNCINHCIYIVPFTNLISYTKLKCLPIHSPSSVEHKIIHRK